MTDSHDMTDGQSDADLGSASRVRLRCDLLAKMIEEHTPATIALTQFRLLTNSVMRAVQLEIMAREVKHHDMDAETTVIAGKVDAAAIGVAVTERACPTASSAWKITLSTIVADEIRKASATEGVTACMWHCDGATADEACSSPSRRPTDCPWDRDKDSGSLPVATHCNFFTSRRTGQPGARNFEVRRGHERDGGGGGA